MSEATNKKNPEPLISVCVTTYKRPDELRECLNHIQNQTLGADKIEVVISDDGSTPATAAMVEEAKRTLDMSITYYWQENQGNVGTTQNRAIERATANLILLMPDDVFLEPDAIAQHVEAHQNRPQQEVAFLGQVVQSPALNQSAFLRIWNPYQFSSLQKDVELPYYMFWACQVSCKRSFMLEHGMFRENLGKASYAANEDAETGFRLYKNGGLRLFYLSAAKGFHYHISTIEDEVKRSIGRGINFHELRKVVPQPEIPVRYHVLTRYTFKDHMTALFGARRRFLMASDSNPLKLLVQHLVRAVAFNYLTVHFFWLPLLKAAESKPAIEKMLNYQAYRGVFYYHYLTGVRRGYRELSSD